MSEILMSEAQVANVVREMANANDATLDVHGRIDDVKEPVNSVTGYLGQTEYEEDTEMAEIIRRKIGSTTKDLKQDISLIRARTGYSLAKVNQYRTAVTEQDETSATRIMGEVDLNHGSSYSAAD